MTTLDDLGRMVHEAWSKSVCSGGFTSKEIAYDVGERLYAQGRADALADVRQQWNFSDSGEEFERRLSSLESEE